MRRKTSPRHNDRITGTSALTTLVRGEGRHTNRNLRPLRMFIVGSIFCFPFTVALLGGPSERPGTLLVAVIVASATLIGGRIVASRQCPAWAIALPAVSYLLVIAFLRHGNRSSNLWLSAMVLLPVIWIAGRGTRAHLCVVLLGVAAVFDLPVLIFDETMYATTDIAHGFALLAIESALGLILVRAAERLDSAERALASTENRFQTMFESTPIGTALVDLHGRVIMANPAYSALFGVDKTAQRSLAETLHPDDAVSLLGSLHEVVRTRSSIVVTQRRPTATGGSRDRFVEPDSASLPKPPALRNSSQSMHST